MMTYQELAEGVAIAMKNENAPRDAMIILAIAIAMGLFFYCVVNFQVFYKAFKDRRVFDFIVQFKELTGPEQKLIDDMIKRHKIKIKYRLLILEQTFNKYMNIDVVRIEEQLIASDEKAKLINNYRELKKKLFTLDN